MSNKAKYYKAYQEVLGSKKIGGTKKFILIVLMGYWEYAKKQGQQQFQLSYQSIANLLGIKQRHHIYDHIGVLSNLGLLKVDSSKGREAVFQLLEDNIDRFFGSNIFGTDIDNASNDNDNSFKARSIGVATPSRSSGITPLNGYLETTSNLKKGAGGDFKTNEKPNPLPPSLKEQKELEDAMFDEQYNNMAVWKNDWDAYVEYKETNA